MGINEAYEYKQQSSKGRRRPERGYDRILRFRHERFAQYYANPNITASQPRVYESGMACCSLVLAPPG